MYTIAVIPPNALTSFSSEDVSKYINFLEIEDPVQMIEKVVEILHMTPDMVGDTAICYETADKVFQLCFLSPDLNPTAPSQEDNTVSSYLCMQRVSGPAVLCCSQIQDNHLCTPISTTIEDIMMILYSKTTHSAVITEPIISPREYKFELDPLTEAGLASAEWQWVETPVLKLSVYMLMKKDPGTIINKSATRIAGRKVFGPAIFILKQGETEFLDMSMELYMQIDKVCHAEKLELNEVDQLDGVKVGDMIQVVNKFRSLKLRYDQEESCKCGVKLPTLVCTGCYRVRYHSRECQINDWGRHKPNCLVN